MRTLVFITCFLPGLLVAQDIDEARGLYLQAGKDRNNVQKYYEYFSNSGVSGKPLLNAYKATAIAMMADYEKGVRNKYSMFAKGRELLESTISEAENNLEIRYLRFAIQLNIPKILGYNHLRKDKDFLLQNIHKVQLIDHKELQEVIHLTLLSSNYLNKSEEKIIRQALNQ